MSKNKKETSSNERKIEKPKEAKKTIKKLIKSMASFKTPLIIIFTFAVFSTVFSIIGPKILGKATTELYNGIISKLSGGSGIDFDKIGKILIILLILYIISAIFGYIQGFIMAKISQKYTYGLREKMINKINKMPLSYFETKTHGEVLSIITNDVDNLNQNLNQSATELVSSFVMIIGIFVMMLTINVPLTIVIILVLPISLVFTGLIVKKSQKHFKNQQDYLGYVNGNIEEMFSGYNVVKAFNAEGKVIKEFEKNNDVLYKSAWKSQFLSGILQPIMMFIGNLSYVAVAILGGYFTIMGKMTVGDIQAMISYSKQFTRPIAQFAEIMSMLQSMLASAERIFDFLEEDEEVFVKNEITKKVKGNVVFKNVKFGYTKDKIVINDFNASINKGQKIAIVGPTGAGKTTMVKLLMNFYNVNAGEILIDGTNINKYDKRELRRSFAMVLQDTWLFNGSIMENLRYGRLEAFDDEVIDAAKMAHVHHFIQTLPEGYNMVLNEETNNISGGQKQLLTIARAILANPKILILDEATSSVDTRTEVLIQQAMDKLMEGRTSFIIAHRLSTIKNADLILVMNDGDIVEQGNHNELLKKNGFYAEMYNSQFKKV